MFKSFFPNPKWFLTSALMWFFINVILWYNGAKEWGTVLGFSPGYSEATMPIGVSRLLDPQLVWFYIWYWIAVGLFALFWKIKANHPWQSWSIGGSALIIFNVWLGVQLSVAVNAWYSPFYDLILMCAENTGDSNLGDFKQLVCQNPLPFGWVF